MKKLLYTMATIIVDFFPHVRTTPEGILLNSKKKQMTTMTRDRSFLTIEL